MASDVNNNVQQGHWDRVTSCLPEFSEATKEKAAKAAQISFIVLTALALTVAVIGSCISLNAVGSDFALNFLDMGAWGNGVLLGLTGLTAGWLALRIINNLRDAKQPETAGEDGAGATQAQRSCLQIW